MSDSTVVKQVYHEWRSLYEGLNKWVIAISRLTDDFQINPSPAKFHRNCKTIVRTNRVTQ